MFGTIFGLFSDRALCAVSVSGKHGVGRVQNWLWVERLGRCLNFIGGVDGTVFGIIVDIIVIIVIVIIADTGIVVYKFRLNFDVIGRIVFLISMMNKSFLSWNL